MSPLWASSTCHYFQFYPYWPFKNHPRRTPRSSEPSAKLKSLFSLLLYTLFLSTLRYFIRTFNGSPFPEPHEGLRYTHFLFSFNARFTCWRRLGTSSPSPMLLSLTALLINRHRHHHPHQQDNYHNQCIRCQSSVQPSTQTSTHHVASPDSSYIFLEKGNKTTSKFSESFNRIKVELPPFLS